MAKDVLSPSFDVLIGRKSLELEKKAGVISIEVTEDLEAPAMVALELVNWDLVKTTFNVDDAQFDPGSEIEIKLGYGKTRTSVFIGEITGLEPEFIGEQSPRMVVRGHDLSHRLMRGTKTRTFTKMKDSDIVAEVARNANLTAKATATQEKHEYVLQHNQTDLGFIRDRAARIGYAVMVQHKSLMFRPLKPETKPATVLKREDLLEFSPRLSAFGLTDKVEVRGWNPTQDKPALVGQSSVNDQSIVKMGKKNGAKVAVQEFGQATYNIINQPITSSQEAKAIAQAELNRRTLGYITGEGTCQGRSDLRAGQSVEIKGIGDRFSGVYYVTATTHRFAKGEGYQTQFSVRRNAT